MREKIESKRLLANGKPVPRHTPTRHVNGHSNYGDLCPYPRITLAEHERRQKKLKKLLVLARKEIARKKEETAKRKQQNKSTKPLVVVKKISRRTIPESRNRLNK